jgi:hypothetical protein
MDKAGMMDGWMHACMHGDVSSCLVLQCVLNPIRALVFGTERMYVGLVCSNLMAFKFSTPFFFLNTFLHFLNQRCVYK